MTSRKDEYILCTKDGLKFVTLKDNVIRSVIDPDTKQALSLMTGR